MALITLRRLAAGAAAAWLACGCSSRGRGSDAHVELRGPEVFGVHGMLYVDKTKEGVRIHGQLTGLEQVPYALFLNPSGLCEKSESTVSSLGVVPFPMNEREAVENTLGRPLLIFGADSAGIAAVDFAAEGLRMEPGETAVLGKSLVVHPAYPHPTDEDKIAIAIGEPVACGVVQP